MPTTPNLTWTTRNLPAVSGWGDVAFGNSVYVAVSSTANIAATSPDGITWTQRTLPTSSSGGWVGIAFGNGVFCAIGAGNSGATSPDGITWTAHTLPVIFPGLSSIAFGNGIFLVAPLH